MRPPKNVVIHSTKTRCHPERSDGSQTSAQLQSIVTAPLKTSGPRSLYDGRWVRTPRFPVGCGFRRHTTHPDPQRHPSLPCFFRLFSHLSTFDYRLLTSSSPTVPPLFPFLSISANFFLLNLSETTSSTTSFALAPCNWCAWASSWRRRPLDSSFPLRPARQRLHSCSASPARHHDRSPTTSLPRCHNRSPVCGIFLTLWVSKRRRGKTSENKRGRTWKYVESANEEKRWLVSDGRQPDASRRSVPEDDRSQPPGALRVPMKKVLPLRSRRPALLRFTIRRGPRHRLRAAGSYPFANSPALGTHDDRHDRHRRRGQRLLPLYLGPPLTHFPSSP